MAEKQSRHHWVPKHILRKFSEDGGRVWQYDKTGDVQPHLASIKSAASSKTSFTDEVEDLLWSIETASQPILRMLWEMTKPAYLDHAVRLLFATYLSAFFWQRSPGVRRHVVENINRAGLMKDFLAESRPYRASSIYQNAVPTTIEKVMEDPNALMAEHWHAAHFLRVLLSKMNWVVMQCKKPLVVLADCGLGGTPWLDSTPTASGGLLVPDVELYFPLAPHRVLLLSWKSKPTGHVELVDGLASTIRHINQFSIRRAHRFVYASHRDESLAHEVASKRLRQRNLRKPLQIDGQHPWAARLPLFRKWVDDIQSKADNPNRHWCASPTATNYRHQWALQPYKLRECKEFPETTYALCTSCGAIEYRYPNGQVSYDDLELRRSAVGRSFPSNWWTYYRVVPRLDELRGIVDTQRIRQTISADDGTED